MEKIDLAKWPLTALLISRRHRLMFMPIAKNANTSLKRLFVHHSDHPDRGQILAGDVHSYLTSHNTGLRLSDYSPEEAQSLLDDERYFRFVVLRHPLRRVTSGYLSKFVMDRQSVVTRGRAPEVIAPAIDWVYASRDEAPDYERSITFEEFVEYVVSHDDDTLDTHFRSQESYLEGLDFDFIAVLENLSPLIDLLESRFAQPVNMEYVNVTPRNRNFIRRWGAAGKLPAQLRSAKKLATDSQLLNAELKRRLERRFAGDIRLWEQASGTRC